MDKVKKYEDALVSRESKLKGAKLGGWILGIFCMFGCFHYAKQMSSVLPLSFDPQEAFSVCLLLTALFLFIAQYYRSQLLHLESVKRFREVLSEEEKQQGIQQGNGDGNPCTLSPPPVNMIKTNKPSPTINGTLEISCDPNRVFIGGNPKGLKSLAKILTWLAEFDQEIENMPDGEREHIHLHANKKSLNSLTEFSQETEICRLDAKGTGEFPAYYKQKQE